MENKLFPHFDKPIGLCSDHAGYELKKYLISVLEENGVEYEDFGTFSEESCDYPDFAHKLGFAIDNATCDQGIAICGSGNGINITINKHQKVRAALCWNIEIAALARQHNNANILTLPARFISKEEAYDMMVLFFNTQFEGGRHQLRIDKIALPK